MTSRLVRLNDRRDRWPLFFGTGAIAASWLYCNAPALQWLADSLQDISAFNGAMLGVGALLLAWGGWYYRQQIDIAPAFRVLPLALMLACGLGAIATRWLIALEQLPVALLVLGTYGFLGLFLSPATWRRGLPIGGAIACLLPFGVQFSTGVGAPARALTAQIVEWILHRWQVPSISAGDIILLDTGVAYVDTPCSGLKSMWTGTLFLLAATGLEGRQIGLRWLGVGLANLLFLAIANTSRVLILVVLTHVLHQPAWAEMLHVPLGLMGFVTASLLTWGLLRWVPRNRQGERSKERFQELQGTKSERQLQLSQMLAVSGLIMLLTVVPHPQISAMPAIDLAGLSWPESLQTRPLVLNSYEQKFFADYPGVTTQKVRFKYQPSGQEALTGALMMVASPTWQAHHSPELCLTGMGYTVDPTAAQMRTAEITGRWLSLNGGEKSAIYWFQGTHQTTDNFFDRFWGEVFRQEPRWTMVSVVFDQSQQMDNSEVRSFIDSVHNSLNQLQSAH